MHNVYSMKDSNFQQRSRRSVGNIRHNHERRSFQGQLVNFSFLASLIIAKLSDSIDCEVYFKLFAIATPLLLVLISLFLTDRHKIPLSFLLFEEFYCISFAALMIVAV